MHLMKKRWWTDETLTTDANGKVSLRGFKGDYTILVGGNAVDLKLDEDQQTKSPVQPLLNNPPLGWPRSKAAPG